MWIVCLAEDSHEMQDLFSLKKNECRLLQILFGALRVNTVQLLNSFTFHQHLIVVCRIWQCFSWKAEKCLALESLWFNPKETGKKWQAPIIIIIIIIIIYLFIYLFILFIFFRRFFFFSETKTFNVYIDAKVNGSLQRRYVLAISRL